MKLIGYLRMKGERDGKSYDDVRLYCSKEDAPAGPDKGGLQIYQRRTQYGSYFPKVKTDQFAALLRKGLKIGSEIQIFQDEDNNTIINLV